MGLSQICLPRFGKRVKKGQRETQTLKIITLQNTQLQQPYVSPLAESTLHRNTHTHTPVQNRAIYESTYFRESAQGQMLHLYSGWQERCAGVAFLSLKCRLHRNSHTSQTWKRALWKLIRTVGIRTSQRRLFPTSFSHASAVTKSDNNSRVRSLC